MARLKENSNWHNAGCPSTHVRSPRRRRMVCQTSVYDWTISLDRASRKVCGVNWIFIIPVPDSPARLGFGRLASWNCQCEKMAICDWMIAKIVGESTSIIIIDSQYRG